MIPTNENDTQILEEEVKEIEPLLPAKEYQKLLRNKDLSVVERWQLNLKLRNACLAEYGKDTWSKRDDSKPTHNTHKLAKIIERLVNEFPDDVVFNLELKNALSKDMVLAKMVYHDTVNFHYYKENE